MVRILPLVAVLVSVSAPAAAQTEAAPVATAAATVPQVALRRGQLVRDANNLRLGVIDAIAADGTVALIVDGRYIRLPASTVTNPDGHAQTTLTKRQISLLR